VLIKDFAVSAEQIEATFTRVALNCTRGKATKAILSPEGVQLGPANKRV